MTDIPPPPRTPIEEQGWAIAERAQNWLHRESNGKFAPWDDIHPGHQANLALQIVTMIAVKTAMEDPSVGAH